ncbi:MAG: ferredoxin--NADP reductase [Bacteroidota bacterium]
MGQNFYPVIVESIIDERGDTKSLVFKLDEAQKDLFNFRAGQYITLKFEIEGKEERRSYSMSSAPFGEALKVSIKRVENGKVSNYVFNNIKEGDTIQVSPPEGRFIYKPNQETCNTVYLFGAGSGITPLMSIIKTILEKEPMSYIHLVYGSRDFDQIIFREELEDLSEKYQGQLFVEHVLSRANLWTGLKGRINSNIIDAFMEKYPQRSTNAEYYLCGPGDMIDTVEQYLIEKNIDKKRIHREYFVSAQSVQDDKSNTTAMESGKIIAHLNGERIELENNGKTIIQQLIDDGHEAPFSCSSGACATCISKVISGTVEMEVCYALDDDEVEEGFVLACQSRMTSDHLEISFDDV